LALNSYVKIKENRCQTPDILISSQEGKYGSNN
jgi:hypothetical protein